MIVANISIPLLGMVDTAVLGRLGSAELLAGSAVAGAVLSQMYWLCGFLRMSSTGLSAQGRSNQSLVQSIVIALLLAVLLWVCQGSLLHLGLAFAEVAPEVAAAAERYLSVRVLGAPAALSNLVFMGWLIGKQRTRKVLAIQVVGNLINIGLDVIFVYGAGLSVEGVAYASVIAEYVMLIMACTALRDAISTGGRALFGARLSSWSALLSANQQMLLRNLLLQACLAFLTLQGARYGTTAAAVNAVLMQFFVLIALGLDGVANAAEALVGEAFGKKRICEVNAHIRRAIGWSSVIGVFYAVVFAFAGVPIITLMTNLPHIQQSAASYLPLMVALPLVAHWCFLFDGVAVGISATKAMRDTMAISVCGIFFPVWWIMQASGNKALWYALLALLLSRGVTLMVAIYRYLAHWRRLLGA